MDWIILIIVNKMLSQSMHMTRGKDHRQILNNVRMTIVMIVQNIRRTGIISMLMFILVGMTHEHSQT